MRKIVISIFCLVIFHSLFAQQNYAKLADSLRYVTQIPYMENCTDPVLWKIISKGKAIVPDLINKMTDTRKLGEAYVPFFAAEYTVADVAFVAMQEIIADIPIFELLGVPLSEECGYCSYWYYVESKKNRKKFQKAVRKWYEENQNNLIWVESNNSLTGDCFIVLKKGHYILQKK